MYLPIFLTISVLFILTRTSSGLNITVGITSTACSKQSQCPASQFCDYKKSICMIKYPVDTTCEHDFECLGQKCEDDRCRQPCHSDSDCLVNREYCTISKYCAPKHCGLCTRDAQCANNNCLLLFCKTSDCSNALKALYKS